MKVQRTRENILDVSLRLFNEKKASNVSTVQIANEMNISPGNLYYYFRNKEEIIRCLWNERIIVEINNAFFNAVEIDSFDGLMTILDWISDHFERYQFFYTEKPTLFLNDPELMNDHAEYDKKNIHGIYNLISNLLDKGYLEPTDEDGRIMLTEGLWAEAEGMLAFYYYLSVCNKRVTDLSRVWMMKIMMYLKPYFRKGYWNEISEGLEDYSINMRNYLTNFESCYISEC